MLKPLLKTRWMQAIISMLIYLYIQLVYFTGSWQQKNTEHIHKHMKEGTPAIFILWHGRLAMMAPITHRPGRIHVMISRHGDGEIIARTLRLFGLSLLRGSSERGDKKQRGGSVAFRGALKALKAGEIVAITPDGPRGPRMRLNDSVITLAAKTGAPVIGITFSCRWGKVINSWDRFLFPFPFTRGIMAATEPVTIAKDADAASLERASQELENQLNTITRDADKLMGRAPVEPA